MELLSSYNKTQFILTVYQHFNHLSVMDAQQKERVKARFLKQQQEVSKMTRASRYLGLTLGAMALTIYGYSMYTVKQETVMKDIDDEIEKEK